MRRFQLPLSEVLSIRSEPVDWAFVPLVAQWILVNEVVYPAYGTFIYQLGTFQIPSNAVFPVTWASAAALFLFALLQFRYRYRVDYVRSVVYSLGLVLSATSVFEILYQNVGAGQGIGNQAIAGQVINLSSIVMALASVRYWQASRIVLAALIVYLCGWLVWLSAGYPQIYSPDPSRATDALVYNVLLKAGTYALLGLVVSRLPPLNARRPHGSTASPTLGGNDHAPALRGPIEANSHLRRLPFT